MSAILITPPAVEPLSLADAKTYLRVEHDDDDAVIGSLITAARTQIEAMTRRALITQTWRFIRDRWPDDGRIKLNTGPVISIGAVSTFDDAGHATSRDPGSFVIDKTLFAIAAPPWALPPPGRATAGIELDVVLGFGPSQADVPPQLRHAIKMLVAHWYENRGLVAIGQSVAMMPASVNAMIGAFRVLSL